MTKIYDWQPQPNTTYLIEPEKVKIIEPALQLINYAADLVSTKVCRSLLLNTPRSV
jgi:hypothetical protein